MASTAETIDHITLTRLVEAGAVRGAEVVGQGGAWEVIVKYGRLERVLAARRGAIRSFRKFETVVAYLKEIGIVDYHVNAAAFDPKAAKKGRYARPDASERMRQAFDAAAHANWVEKAATSVVNARRNTSHAQATADAESPTEAIPKNHAGSNTLP